MNDVYSRNTHTCTNTRISIIVFRGALAKTEIHKKKLNAHKIKNKNYINLYVCIQGISTYVIHAPLPPPPDPYSGELRKEETTPFVKKINTY